ncbi:MAG: hypothetical protein U0746_11040 [Gemmataceae bacterium]
MKRWPVVVAAVAVFGMFAMTAASQPPDGKEKGQPPGEKGFGRGKGDGKGGRRPRFELGQLLPPFARDQLQLSDDQQKQLDALEKEVKEKLSKILTADQMRMIENMSPPGQEGRGEGKGKGQGGRGEGKGKRGEGKDGKGPPRDEKSGTDRPDRPPE